jgi:hypothetical protein
MTSQVLELTAHLDLNPGASELAIRQLQAETQFQFPADYLEFLRFANGGETNIDKNVGYESGLWRLYPAEEIIEWTRDYFFDVEAMNDEAERRHSPRLPSDQSL